MNLAELQQNNETAKRRSRPIRVAHFYSSLGIYGAERWAVTLIKYLDPALIDSMVITIGTKPASTTFRDFLIHQGVRTEHLAIAGKLNVRAALALRKLLRRERIDVLHTHGFKSDIIGYLACCASNVALVSTPHGWSADENWRIKMYEAVGRIFLRAFDRIYPVSPALHDDLAKRGFGVKMLKLISNGVDIAAFDACYRNRRARLPHEPFRIVFAGRLCKPKGVADLIRSVALARSMSAELRIVGDGPERHSLESLARQLEVLDKVQFLGVVPTIVSQMQWADVLVLPSYSEGIPRTIMEAFAAGVPVIGSDIPGVRVLIEHMQTGLLVPPGDHEALARAIMDLAANPELCRRLALSARDRVSERFSARRVAAEYTAEYRAVAMEHAP
jgi:glycosyltransferase involved in cell wall biosynthesis